MGNNKLDDDWLVQALTHLALDVHGVQLSVVVLRNDLHYILLLKGIFIHPLHGTHTLNWYRGAHLQQSSHKPLQQLTHATPEVISDDNLLEM